MKVKSTVSMKSVKSLKSMKSLRSMRSLHDGVDFEKQRRVEFEDCVKSVCFKFQCPQQVIVKKEMQCDEYLKILKQSECTSRMKRMSLAPPLLKTTPSARTSQTDKDESSASLVSEIESDAIIVTALYSLEVLQEISLRKLKNIPRMVMQVLGLVIPNFRQLTKFSIKSCRINKYTVYELNKFIPITNITEVCLDDCPLPEANYTLLLETPCQLKYLSLTWCKINDEVCALIASCLSYQKSAEATLMVLNLSSNHITDIGAEHLGIALRTNRHLRYLNLCNNNITDAGANHILSPLKEFILTPDEALWKRKTYLIYLKRKFELYRQYLLDNLKMEKKRKESPSIKKAKEKLADLGGFGNLKAEAYAIANVGQYLHPYAKTNTKLTNHCLTCNGNFVLSYLNLGYNQLSYASIKKMNEVLIYQNTNRKPFQTGLIKIVIDGNNIPVNCYEYSLAFDLLSKNLFNLIPKGAERGRLRTRVSIPSKYQK